MLTLLAVLLPAVRAFAYHQITVLPSAHGTISADRKVSGIGQTVTLTVSPESGYVLKRASLTVEVTGGTGDSEAACMTRGTGLDIGKYIEIDTQSSHTYTFAMPDGDVEVSGCFCQKIESAIEVFETGDMQKPMDGTIILGCIEEEGKNVILEEIILPDTGSDKKLTIFVPSNLTAPDGSVCQVTGIDTGTFLGLVNVTDIYLPETDKPLELSRDALRLSMDESLMAYIHTPSYLLDDYALMKTMQDHLHAMKIMAVIHTVNKYWTWSCGVDVVLPEHAKVYVLGDVGESSLYMIEQTDAFDESGTLRVIKANTGVLVAGALPDTDYTMVACPNTSYSEISEQDNLDDPARQYESQDMLIPVTEPRHFESEGIYILSGNMFHPILQEGTQVEVTACKAVLYLPNNSSVHTRTISLNQEKEDE